MISLFLAAPHLPTAGKCRPPKRNIAVNLPDTFRNMTTPRPNMVEALALIYINRAKVELDLMTHARPITKEEFPVLYAKLLVGLNRAKDSDDTEKQITRRMLDIYVDECLAPLLGLDITAQQAASQVRFTFGKHFNVAGMSRISKERFSQLDKLCPPIGSVILDSTVLARLIPVITRDAARSLFIGACNSVAVNTSLDKDVRLRALALLEEGLKAYQEQ